MALGGVNLGTAFGQIVVETDRAVANIGRLRGDLTNFAQQTQTVGFGLQSLATGLLAIGTGLAAGLTLGVKTFVGFEEALRNVASISPFVRDNFESISESVVALGMDTARAPEELATALYEIYSAGITGADGLVILEAAANTANAGLTDTATAAGVLTGVLNSKITGGGGDMILDATEASDILFQMVEQGVFTFEELAGQIGDNLPLAASLGVSLEEIGAAYAVLTQNSVPLAEATTQVNAIMSALLKPSEEFSAILQDHGFASGVELLTEGFGGETGLAGALAFLDEILEDNNANLPEFSGNIRAIRGVLGLLTGGDMEKFNSQLAGMRDSFGSTAEALKQQQKSLAFSFRSVRVAFQGLGIALVGPIAPALKTIADAIASLVKAFSSLPSGVREFVSILIAAATAMFLLAGGIALVLARVYSMRVGLAAIGLSFSRIFLPIRNIITLITILSSLFAGDFLGIRSSLGNALGFIQDFVDGFNRYLDFGDPTQHPFIRFLNAVVTGLRDINGEKTPAWIEDFADTISDLADDLEKAAAGLQYLMQLLGILDPFGTKLDAEGVDEFNRELMASQRLLRKFFGEDIANAFIQEMSDLRVPLRNLVVDFQVLGRAVGDFFDLMTGGNVDLKKFDARLRHVFGVTLGRRMFQSFLRLRRAMEDFGSAVGEAAGSLLKMFGIDSGPINSWADAIHAVGDALEALIGFIRFTALPAFGNLLLFISDNLALALEGLADLLRGDFSGALDSFTDIISNLFDVGLDLGEIVLNVGGWLIEQGVDLATAIYDQTVGLIGSIPFEEIIVTVGDWIVTGAVNLWDQIQLRAMQLYAVARGIGIKLFDVAVDVAEWVIGGAVDLYPKIREKALELYAIARRIGIRLFDVAVEVADWIVTSSASVYDRVRTYVHERAVALVGFVRGIDIGEVAISVRDWIVSSAKSLYQAIKDSVLVDRIAGLVQGIPIGSVRATIEGWIVEQYTTLRDTIQAEIIDPTRLAVEVQGYSINVKLQVAGFDITGPDGLDLGPQHIFMAISALMLAGPILRVIPLTRFLGVRIPGFTPIFGAGGFVGMLSSAILTAAPAYALIPFVGGLLLRLTGKATIIGGAGTLGTLLLGAFAAIRLAARIIPYAGLILLAIELIKIANEHDLFNRIQAEINEVTSNFEMDIKGPKISIKAGEGTVDVDLASYGSLVIEGLNTLADPNSDLNVGIEDVGEKIGRGIAKVLKVAIGAPIKLAGGLGRLIFESLTGVDTGGDVTWSDVGNIIVTGGDAVATVVEAIMQPLVNFFEGITEGLISEITGYDFEFENVWNAIQNKIEDTLFGAPEQMGMGRTGARTGGIASGGFGEMIKNAIQDLLRLDDIDILDMDDILEPLDRVFEDVVSSIGEKISELWDSISAIFSGRGGGGVGAGGAPLGLVAGPGFADAVSGPFEGLVGAIDGIVEKFQELVDFDFDLGGIQSFFGGIADAANAALGPLADLWGFMEDITGFIGDNKEDGTEGNLENPGVEGQPEPNEGEPPEGITKDEARLIDITSEAVQNLRQGMGDLAIAIEPVNTRFDNFRSSLGLVKSPLENFRSQIGTGATNALVALQEKAHGVATSFADFGTRIGTSVGPGIDSLKTKVAEVGPAFLAAGNTVRNTFTAALREAAENGNLQFAAMLIRVVLFKQEMATQFAAIATDATNFGTLAAQGFSNTFSEGLNIAIVNMAEASSTIASLAQGIAEVMTNMGIAAGEGFAYGIRSGMDTAVGAVQNGLGAIRGAVGGFSLAAEGQSIGASLGQGIASGIQGSISAVAGAAAQLVGAALQAARDAAAISSPSRLFAIEIGRPIAQGIAVGIKEDAPLAAQQAADAVMLAHKAALGVGAQKMPYHGNRSGLTQITVYASIPAGDVRQMVDVVEFFNALPTGMIIGPSSSRP